MITVENLISVALGFALLAPGFLIMFGRSRLLTGRMKSVSSAAFEYLVVSTVYFASVYPFLPLLESATHYWPFILLVIAPLSVGFVLGFISQKQYLRRIIGKTGINPIHSSPTGWDYVFSNRVGFSWVVVTLTNGKRFYGVFGPKSLASSDLDNKDIYLEDVRDNNFQKLEKDGRVRGVWINGSELRSIEIIGD